MKKEILEEFLYKYFNLQVNIIDFQFYEFISQGRLDILIEDYKTKSYDFIVNNNLNIFENNFTNNSFNSICDIISFFIVKKLSLKNLVSLFKKNNFKLITKNIDENLIINNYASFKCNNKFTIYLNCIDEDNFIQIIEFIEN